MAFVLFSSHFKEKASKVNKDSSERRTERTDTNSCNFAASIGAKDLDIFLFFGGEFRLFKDWQFQQNQEIWKQFCCLWQSAFVRNLSRVRFQFYYKFLITKCESSAKFGIFLSALTYITITMMHFWYYSELLLSKDDKFFKILGFIGIFLE